MHIAFGVSGGFQIYYSFTCYYLVVRAQRNEEVALRDPNSFKFGFDQLYFSARPTEKLLRQNKKKTLCQTEFSSRKSLPYDGKFLCILSELLRYQSSTFYWSNFVLLDFELDKFISYSKVIPGSVPDK